MTDASTLARELACAFLDGEWLAPAMAGRAAEVTGLRQRWQVELARRALLDFPAPPTQDSLTTFVRSDVAFCKMWDRQWQRIELRRRFLPTPVMQPCQLPITGPLPVWCTPGELAAWLDLTPGQLDAAADLQDRHRRAAARLRNYHHHWKRRRLIEAPKSRQKGAQRRLLAGLFQHIPVHDAAHGFVPGRSVRSHASLHTRQEVVARIDLSSFFPSIRRARVHGLIQRLGYPPEVSRLLAGLCTTRTPPDVLAIGPPEAQFLYDAPHLPQGAPTSPVLANLLCWRLDTRLTARALASGHRYSRYADDLTLSGPRAGMSALLRTVETIVEDEGFMVHPTKTRVMHRSQQQRVTGVVVNDGLHLPRRKLERLEATLFKCAQHGPEGQNRSGHPDFRAHLRGRIAHVSDIDPERGKRLSTFFEAITWSDQTATAPDATT